MKELKLSNGVSFQFSDVSTIYDLVGVYETYAEIDPVREALTIANLKGATLNDEAVTDIIPVGVQINTESMQGNVEAHFINRDKTDVEKLYETQAEQEEAINYLLME